MTEIQHTTSAAGGLRAAMLARDTDAITRALAPDVVFRGPVIPTPFHGRESVAALLELVTDTILDLRYTDELVVDDVEACVFTGRVGKRNVEGLDLLRL